MGESGCGDLRSRTGVRRDAELASERTEPAEFVLLLRTRASASRAGISLTEMMIAITLMITALLALSRSVVSSMVTTETSHDTSLATSAARAMVETLKSAPFDEVFARFNDDPADDPGGAGTALGNGFAIAGLEAVPGDADGLSGEIVFPSVEGASGEAMLREDFDSLLLGTPRDLNGDGAVDALDHSDDYRLLPVVVRIRWRGQTGPSVLELRTMLAGL